MTIFLDPDRPRLRSQVGLGSVIARPPFPSLPPFTVMVRAGGPSTPFFDPSGAARHAAARGKEALTQVLFRRYPLVPTLVQRPVTKGGQMFDFLPPFLKRLYQSFRVPYARGTRVRETPEPDPEIAVSMRERMFRVEIIQDAFCERRPKPQRLFRSPPGHRDMYSWCDLEVSRYPRARHRCAHCSETRALFKRANDGDWQAEVRLHRLATRASMRLLVQRRAWAETRRRQRAARTPRPGPPPVIWIMLGWKRWRDRKREYPPATDRWFIVERRAAEAKLVRAHTRKLQRMYQRSRARARDRELARDRDVVGRKSAERAFRHREARSAVAIQGNVTNACRAALDRHAANRRRGMTVTTMRLDSASRRPKPPRPNPRLSPRRPPPRRHRNPRRASR